MAVDDVETVIFLSQKMSAVIIEPILLDNATCLPVYINKDVMNMHELLAYLRTQLKNVVFIP